ncbi:MAG: ABC transporter permease subunit/CPBP intramembrane protease [Planctomycetota bacterium]
MIPPKIRAVYVKELRDALRDRRTLLASVVVPILLYPIMLLGLTEVALSAKAKLDREVYTVAIPEGSGNFFDQLVKQPIVEPKNREDEEVTPPLLKFKEMNNEQARQALAEREIHAVVTLSHNFEYRLKAYEPVLIDVQFDKAEHRSMDASVRLTVLFRRYEKTVIEARLKARHLAAEFIQPFTYKTTNVAMATKVGGLMFGSFLPLLFIMMIITGAIYPAIDMTAGEKERSTLETLIGAPVRPIEIITGKFLAVATLALGNAALNVGSFGLTFSLMPLSPMNEFAFPWSALPLTMLILIPLALFFAALLLAVASFATNHKEAQIYCLPIYLAPVLGMMATTMPGIELESPLLLVPVVNSALLIKELFLGHGAAPQIFFVFVSTCLYAAGMVTLAARVFAREEVLFSAQGSLRLFLKRRFFKPSALPKSGDALLVVALLFPINFYVQNGLVKALADIRLQVIPPGTLALLLIIPQYLLFLGVPLLVAWYLKLNLKQTFQWRVPSLRSVAGGLFLGLGAFFVVQQLVAWQSCYWRFTGEDDVLRNSFNLFLESPGGTVALIALIGITPGICEEHLFRGFLQQGLTGAGKWTCILLVGVIFGAYHVRLFNQPALIFVGITLAYAAYETASIWPSVIFHFIYNSSNLLVPLAFERLGVRLVEPQPGEPLPGLPLQILAPAVAFFISGVLLVRGGCAKLNHELRMINRI